MKSEVRKRRGVGSSIVEELKMGVESSNLMLELELRYFSAWTWLGFCLGNQNCIGASYTCFMRLLMHVWAFYCGLMQV